RLIREGPHPPSQSMSDSGGASTDEPAEALSRLLVDCEGGPFSERDASANHRVKNGGNMEYLLVKVILSLISIGIVITIMVRRKKYSKSSESRKSTFVNVAQSLGFLYQDSLPSIFIKTLESSFEEFKLAPLNFQRTGYNVIEGKKNGIQWTIFDYSSAAYFGKFSTNIFKVVFVAECQNFKFPYFHVVARGKNNVKLPKWLDVPVSKDFVNFDNFSKFSNEYFVFGKDKVAIRELISSPLITYLEKMTNLITIEALADRIIFIVPPDVSLESIAEVFESIEQILNLLKKSV
ncbi:MAG: hypothetical protein NTY34_05860, partial [Candidatus Omnitrophica bacterium]|nr:hypothetical protein [Candidatus Omnitrophota bacterium]